MTTEEFKELEEAVRKKCGEDVEVLIAYLREKLVKEKKQKPPPE